MGITPIPAAQAGLPEADALVLPTNDYLWMAAGPALDLKKRAGEEVEIEAVRAGPIGLGEVVVTSGGKEKLRAILHAAVMGQELQVDAQAAARAVRSALVLANEKRWERLLVHSFLATGRATRPESLTAALGALVETLLDGSSLRDVTLLAQDDHERSVLHEGLLRIIQSHG